MEYSDKIFLLLGCIFEVYIYYDFFYAYFDIRTCFQVIWRRLAASILAVIGLYLINSLANSYINLLGFIVIIGVLFVSVFKANIGSRIVYFLIALFIGSGCEFLFGVLLSVPSYIQKQRSFVNLSDIPWHMFTMKLLTYMLLSIVKQFFGSSKKALSIRLYINYLFIPIASFGIMLLTYYTSLDVEVVQSTKALFCLSFALMLLGNIFIFYAFNRYSDEICMNNEQKLIISRQSMDLQYYSQIQMIDNKYQVFIHDISHHLKTIGALAKEKKIDNILSIIHELNIELENNELIIYSDNPVVNSVLSEKKSVAEKNNIDMDIYVEPGVTFVGISDADIITMLSNLLDNAIRAAGDANDKVITVRLYVENGGAFNIVKIQNYFTGEIEKTNSGFKSTKMERGIHGIGIKSVENTAEKYNGYIECFVGDMLFTSVLILPT